jgi:hypothetical protein
MKQVYSCAKKMGDINGDNNSVEEAESKNAKVKVK